MVRKSLLMVVIFAMTVIVLNSAAQAVEYATFVPKVETTSSDTFKVAADAGADTSKWYACASWSAFSIQLKAQGVTETDSNGVSVVVQWSNKATTPPGDFDGSFRSTTGTDSLSVVFGDTNWVIGAVSSPPAQYVRFIVRPTADNKIDETGGGAYAWMRIYWIRSFYVR